MKEAWQALKEVQDDQFAFAVSDTKKKIKYILSQLEDPPAWLHEHFSDTKEFVDWHIFRYEQLADLFTTLAGLLKAWSDDVNGEEEE